MREISVVVHANSASGAIEQAEKRMIGEGWEHVKAKEGERIDDDRWRVKVIGHVSDEMLNDRETGPQRTKKGPITGGPAK